MPFQKPIRRHLGCQSCCVDSYARLAGADLMEGLDSDDDAVAYEDDDEERVAVLRH